MLQAQSLKSRFKGKRGFTLVELLVVIGIIAVLISVLLPSLAAARRSATSVKCLSNLKNLHNAFLMYAGDFKNAMPVGRQDSPDNPPAPIQNSFNAYWQDGIYPYLLKSAVPTSTFAKTQLETYRKSVLWCPVWEADSPHIDLNSAYNERFKTGYGYNIYFGFRPDFPKPDAMLPASMQAMRSAVWNGGTGKYYKRNEISMQAERALVADTNLWILCMGITNAQGALLGQSVQPVVEHNSTPGGMNYDRYRHGKPPKVMGTRFDTKGGTVKYNVLFVDGHADSLGSIPDGYKALRMRYP